MISLDAKKTSAGDYEVYTRCGLESTGLNAVHIAQKMESLGAGEILINSIDRDGTRDGYDIELIKQISQSVQIPVVAIGGAHALSDFSDAVQEGGASAVAAGSMFVFIGKKRAVLINYPEKSELEATFN
jgi:cyclase